MYHKVHAANQINFYLDVIEFENMENFPTF